MRETNTVCIIIIERKQSQLNGCIAEQFELLELFTIESDTTVTDIGCTLDVLR